MDHFVQGRNNPLLVESGLVVGTTLRNLVRLPSQCHVSEKLLKQHSTQNKLCTNIISVSKRWLVYNYCSLCLVRLATIMAACFVEGPVFITYAYMYTVCNILLKKTVFLIKPVTLTRQNITGFRYTLDLCCGN